MTAEQQQYVEQLRVLQERFPQENEEKLTRMLRRHGGDVDQVRAHLKQREFRSQKLDKLEARFGAALTTLEHEHQSSTPLKRARILKIMERFDGNMEYVQEYLQKMEARKHGPHDRSNHSRQQQREEQKAKYAAQLAELSTAGVNVHCPCVLRQLEKHQGDAEKVAELMKHRKAKKEEIGELESKYASQVAQLEADGIQVKNKRILARLLQKADGQVELVKQFLAEKQEKHHKKREYAHKHRGKSPSASGQEGTEPKWACKKRREMSADDLDNLKRLRSAGVHGNPNKVLELFYECNESVEMTAARAHEERDRRDRERSERMQKRTLLDQAEGAYVPLTKREDWPEGIEQVYLDGNNMMFVIDSLRRLCLNRAGKKTERAIGEIAAAWNEQMHIPHVDLVFDATRQLDPIGSVKVSSAQPTHKTTDDMFVELARQPENQAKNKHTIIVTSDRALGALLQREGCFLVKPYQWFAHCVMVLTPDLIKHEEATGTTTAAPTPTTIKTRYNFDELVHRVANIDL